MELSENSPDWSLFIENRIMVPVGKQCSVSWVEHSLSSMFLCPPLSHCLVLCYMQVSPGSLCTTTFSSSINTNKCAVQNAVCHSIVFVLSFVYIWVEGHYSRMAVATK